MNCEILETLYVKSNGDIPCNDCVGENQLLGRVQMDNPDWSITAVLDNQLYGQIRKSLTRGEAPWPHLCGQCSFIKNNEPLCDTLHIKHIRKLQIEAALTCNLSCPACNSATQIRIRPRPFVFSPAMFERLLGSLQQGAFQLQEIEYCGQGEPLTNSDFPKLVLLARKYYPEAHQRLITNGNFDYWKATHGEYLEEIIVSCDGYYQSNYERYRVHGNVERVLKFMKDVPRTIAGRRQLLIWKYILFEFNDTDDEITAAQRAAKDLGIDTILFVFTHSHFRSTRYTPHNVNALPLLYHNAVTNFTPLFHNRRISFAHPKKKSRLADLSGKLSRFLNRPVHIVIDQVSVTDGNTIHICGWALARETIDDIVLRLNELSLGSARTGLLRPDVLDVFTEFTDPYCGFAISAPVPTPPVGDYTIWLELKLHSKHRVVAAFPYHFTEPSHIVD